MRISDLFKIGFKNLTRRKTRTILTTLGVMIGSLFIIITISIGNGMNYNFESQVMQQGGLTTITVNTMADVFDDKGNWLSSKTQKLDDNVVKQLKQLEHVRAVTPVLNQSASLYSGKYMTGIYITAMDYRVMEDFDFPELAFGAYPTAKDPKPIVFGFSTVSNFYDPMSRMGMPKEIDIQKKKVELRFEGFPVDPKKKPFSIPLKNPAKMIQTNGEFDFNTYMDIEYFKKLYLKYCSTLSLTDRRNALKAIESYQQIKLNVDNIKNIEKVQKEIEKLGYQSYSMIQFLLPLKDASENIQLILLVMAIVILLGSALSIANTMIMSIYERTKEIGIMKVLGCMVSDIRKLFLIEAAIIGIFGGVIGIILGYVASWGINKFGAPIFGTLVPNFSGDMSNIKFSIIPIYLPAFSLAVSISVGLLSGYFPARRATRIRAIEAMRTDG